MNVFRGTLESACLSACSCFCLSTCEQNTCFCQSPGGGINSTKRHIRLVQIGSICRRQKTCAFKTGIILRMGRKRYGKRWKCWFPAFSPFPIMFFQGR